MQENTIPQLPDPSGFRADAFKDVIRDGARKLIEQAIHAELSAFMAAFSGKGSMTGGHVWCAMVTCRSARL